MHVNFDKRRLQRVNLRGDTALFLEYGSYYKGELKDVSYGGFRVIFSPIGPLPTFWPDLILFFRSEIWRMRVFRIVICARTHILNTSPPSLLDQTKKDFLVSAYPRWILKTENRMEIGFKISESPSGWQFFVHQKLVEQQYNKLMRFEAQRRRSLNGVKES